MVKFEESRKMLLESCKEYVACSCKMNGALLVLKDCIDSALHRQYLNRELNGKRIAYIECELCDFSTSIKAIFYLLPFNPIPHDDSWSIKEKKIIDDINSCIIKKGNYITIPNFNSKLVCLKHGIIAVDVKTVFFNIDSIENMDIDKIIINQ